MRTFVAEASINLLLLSQAYSQPGRPGQRARLSLLSFNQDAVVPSPAW